VSLGLSFAKYAALVKNLRGVVLLDPADTTSLDMVKWLVRRFRYRNLGLTPLILEKLGDEYKKYLGGKPFHVLAYPINELRELPLLLSRHTGLGRDVAEALVFASMYISPLLVLNKSFCESIEEISTGHVRTCKEFDDSTWKLHLRIADYSILDFYSEAVSEAEELIEGACRRSTGWEEKLKNVLEKRRERVEKDVKRYWRISCSEGRVFLYYVDMLSLASSLLSSLSGNHAAALAIVPAVMLQFC